VVKLFVGQYINLGMTSPKILRAKKVKIKMNSLPCTLLDV